MSSYRILVVDDEPSMRDLLRILLEREGYVVQALSTAEEALEAFDEDPHDCVVSDMSLPGASGIDLLRDVKARAAAGARDVPVIVVTAYGTTESAVEAMKIGAFDYVMKPFSNDELKLIVRRALETRQLKEENLALKQALQDRYHYGTLVGSSPAMAEVYSLVERVKDTRISCLIVGESGTGKELVARAIHYSGTRSGGPFVPVNCGAIPETLIESELFGYRKGAFTGAVRDRAGLFEAASGGTLFLDEIGEMPLMTQVKLLRAIQERRILPVGGTAEREVDVRILASTNKDLQQEVERGTFREDLYYRINVVTLPVPALALRGDDILELTRHFVTRYAREYGKAVEGLTPDAANLLRRYPFPGNVRELQNIVERAVALSAGPRIGPEALPGRVQEVDRPADEIDGMPDEGIDLEARLQAVERHWLLKALDRAGGNRTQAARLLGLTFRSFRYRLQKHGLASE
ncbi:MAG: sigma-54-dependent Fis family transcriptional regulator [Deltaproteobacteria bacterium]|nr:sigma-54-dependent Fis family transcriptional regulator [Deltaproteobacteria bacterium]